MSPFPTSEEPNPYAPSSDWKPGQDTFTSQAAGIWAEGFAAGRAAFDAVVAERDARWQDDNAILQAVIAERDAAIAAGQNALQALAEASEELDAAGCQRAASDAHKAWADNPMIDARVMVYPENMPWRGRPV